MQNLIKDYYLLFKRINYNFIILNRFEGKISLVRSNTPTNKWQKLLTTYFWTSFMLWTQHHTSLILRDGNTQKLYGNFKLENTVLILHFLISNDQLSRVKMGGWFPAHDRMYSFTTNTELKLIMFPKGVRMAGREKMNDNARCFLGKLDSKGSPEQPDTRLASVKTERCNSWLLKGTKELSTETTWIWVTNVQVELIAEIYVLWVCRGASYKVVILNGTTCEICKYQVLRK